MKKSNTPGLDVAGGQDKPATESETIARAAIESLADRTMGDHEWGRARARLLEFAAILRVWQKELPTDESELRKAA